MSTELYDETYRPQFHFTPRQNWMNDPNGLVYYKGEYHLFFQHNPYGIEWGNMTWGHAIGTDLVHWQQVGNALDPDELGTMYSGSAVVDWNNTAGFHTGEEKTIVLIYTAAGGQSPQSQDQRFTQCLAYSNDRGLSFIKYAQNPVLAHVVKENRDPKVIWHAPTQRWIMALYMDGHTYALFSAPDLKQWTHLHDIELTSSTECPDFFEIPVKNSAGETRWVLIGANGHYVVGAFDGKRFIVETDPQQVDFGANYYAVQTFSDTPDQRRIQVAWMAGGKYPDMPFNQQMSFPCTLELMRTPAGMRLRRWPVQEIETLYRSGLSWHDLSLRDASQNILLDEADTLDLSAIIDVADDTGNFTFTIRGHALSYSARDRLLTCLGQVAPLESTDHRINLRVLIDRSSIEVFANHGILSMTSCFVPDAANHRIELSGQIARVDSLTTRTIHSIWR